MPRPIASIAALAWMGVIFALSSGRRDLLPSGTFGVYLSNAAHAPIFGLLALLAGRALGSTALGLAVAIAYAIIDECHQAFVPGRSASVLDLATDAVGAGAAVWLVATGGRLPEPVARRRIAVAALATVAAAGLATAFSF
jgi:hypothetical protein